MDLITNLTWPVIGLIIVVAFFAIVKAMSAFYIRVPPNMAAFFYGARSGKKKAIRVPVMAEGMPSAAVMPPGTIVVTGGGRIRKPIIEAVDYLDLSEITLEGLKVLNMPNVDGVLVTVEAVANIRFKDDAASLLIAGGRFLGKSHEEIKRTAQETLESNLRGVIGTLTVEDLIKDRDKFRQAVLSEAGEDLARLGMQIDVFNPQSIDDEQGYIEALGRKRTAEVVRDADIGEAEAQAAARKKSTDAKRAAEIVAQDNERQEQEAIKNKNVAVQQYTAEVAKETAVAEQAGPLSTAAERRKVVKAETEVDEERVKAEIQVEQQRIQKEQKAQEAAIVVPAKAKADATVREAEGYQNAEVAKADGDKNAIMARADASSHKVRVEGVGEADAVRAKGLAEAEVIRQTGFAKAEALHKAAEAYREFGNAALTLEMMKAAPHVVESFAPVLSAMTAHLGNIDRLNVYDSGGNGDSNSGALSRLANQAPDVLLNLAQQFQARGIDVKTLAQSAGIDLSKLLGSRPDTKPPAGPPPSGK